MLMMQLGDLVLTRTLAFTSVLLDVDSCMRTLCISRFPSIFPVLMAMVLARRCHEDGAVSSFFLFSNSSIRHQGGNIIYPEPELRSRVSDERCVRVAVVRSDSWGGRLGK